MASRTLMTEQSPEMLSPGIVWNHKSLFIFREHYKMHSMSAPWKSFWVLFIARAARQGKKDREKHGKPVSSLLLPLLPIPSIHHLLSHSQRFLSSIPQICALPRLASAHVWIKYLARIHSSHQVKFMPHELLT